MKKILQICFGLVICMSFFDLKAQDRTISGKVTSIEDGSALPGVNVVLQGTTTGTVTDINGEYSLSVPSSGGTLTFSFIGLANEEVEIGSRSIIDVQMSPDVTELSEIIVTGVAQGTSVKKLGFSIGKIDEKTLQEVPATDPANALRGKVSGVQVVQPSGLPGTAPTIRIRGSSVINSGSNGPLIIVDGIITSNSLADINMNDVESIEVIKGAAGAALYGSLAGNGVVQIRTKRGADKPNTTRVTFRNEFGFTNLQNLYPLSNSHFYELDDSGDFVLTNPADPVTRIQEADQIMDNPYPRLFDQQEEIFGSRNFMNNVLQIATSSNMTDVYFSFDNLENEPTIEGLQAYERRTARLNVDHIIDRFRVSSSLSFSNSIGPNATERSQGGFIYGTLLVEPDLDLRTPADDGQPFSPSLRFNGNGVNPLYNSHVQDWDINRDRFLGTGLMSYDITDDLKVEGQYSIDRLWRTITNFQPIDYLTPSNPDGTGGSLSESEYQNTAQVYTASLYYNKTFGDLSTKFSLRYQFEDYDTDYLSVGGSNFALGGIPQFDALDQTTVQATSEVTEVKAENVFFNVSLDYKDKYIVEGLIRRDGSSLFGEEERNQTFGRASAAYRITEDININGIQEWKVRASYGVAGDRPNFTYQYETFSLSSGTATKNTLGNKNLKPAILKELELGTNIDFLDRFNFEFTYSKTVAEDNIFNVPLSGAAGFGSQWQNAGTLETDNYEFALGAQIIDKPNFNWNVSLVGNHYKSTITELDVPEFNLGGSTTAGMFRITEGGIYGEMYGNVHATSLSQLQTDANGDIMNVAGYVEGETTNTQVNDYTINRYGYVVLTDGIGTPTESAVLLYDTETGQPVDKVIGNGLPDILLGLNSTITYKNFSLYFLLDAQLGGDIYNATKQLLYFNERHADLDQAGVAVEERTAAPFWTNSLYNGNNPTAHFVEDATYLKVREINLSYNIGNNVMESLGIENIFYDAKISLIGRNLFTFTDYSGFDPEVALGSRATNFRVDSFTVPIYRTFSASLQLRF